MSESVIPTFNNGVDDRQTSNGRYADFIRGKARRDGPDAIVEVPTNLHSVLFPFQAELVCWALRKGRGALFADCGLGKTLMQLEWARVIAGRTLIVAPLAVAHQTVREARKLGLDIHYSRDGIAATQITVTNYEMVGAFDPTRFQAVVLDESSILKNIDGKTRLRLTQMFSDTPYRLCCTATPAPNDIAEFGNHAEFLGVSTRQEMLSTYFVHDDEGWRLKGHARSAFYRWLASWAIMLNKPSDIGFLDVGFDLPELSVEPIWVDGNQAAVAAQEGKLFLTGLQGVIGRSSARKATLTEKVAAATEAVSAEGQWLVWCGLNDEGRMLHRAVPSLLVEGSQGIEQKEAALTSFIDGESRVLITKAKIAGMGLNLQNCHKVLFLGLNDSYETFYQAIRRVWRYGQVHPVEVKVVLSDIERPIWENIQRKQSQAEEVAREMVKAISTFQNEELHQSSTDGVHNADDEAEGEGYRLLLGDCVERMGELPPASVDFAIFSPPFLNLYVYSDDDRDMGNNSNAAVFMDHFGFMLSELLRVVRPGRNVACHVAQVPAHNVHDGFIGLKDFRGAVIAAFSNHGFFYHGEVVIDKDPQAQAIRTKSKALLFRQLEKDASWLRPGLADYILLFRAPGENAIPIHPDIDNETWIQWARPVWYNIRESDTLNVAEARSEKDERHIAPLQLGTIERCIRLWSNKGETVLSPFAGIGSEGYEAILNDRRFIGVELKPEYFKVASRNLARAVERKSQGHLL